MPRRFRCASSAIALLWLGFATLEPDAWAADAPNLSSEKWAAAIDKLTANDLTSPPPRDGIVFVGSSSIVKWTTLKEDFPGQPVINRGFGGSELADSVYYAERIIIPYQPRLIVLYAGDNDIAAGKSAQKVAEDFESFRAKIHTELPRTRIVYIGIKPSPSRAKFHEQMKEANTLIAKACAKDSLCRFVDVWKLMLDANGRPRPDLFLDDQLHMNSAGYAIWRKVLTPYFLP